MLKKTKIDEIVEVCIQWNARKITAYEAMMKIFKINQKYILSKLNPKNSPKRCKFCGKELRGTITFCNNECKYNDKKN